MSANSRGTLALQRAQRRERTLASLTLAVGALALGLLALDLLSDHWLPALSPTDGLLALVGAGLLFALAVLRAPRQPRAPFEAHAAVGPGKPPVIVDARRRWIGVGWHPPS